MKEVEPKRAIFMTEVTFIVQPLLSLSSSQDQKAGDEEPQIRLRGERRCFFKFLDSERLQLFSTEPCGGTGVDNND